MAGIGGGGSGSGGGDNNEERLKNMVANHLRGSELSAINTRTPEGLASLTTILGQALQAGLTAREAQRDEEARKAAEAKAVQKKKKRDERATTRALSTRSLKKKRKKDERDAIRKAKLDLKKKEEERKKLPLITLAEEGIPTELAYTGAKSTIRHIVSTNFARGVEWGTLSKVEQKRVINQLKAARQVKEVTEQLAKAKKAREFGRSDRDLKALELKLAECQSVVDEVVDPPLKFFKAVERVKLVPNTTHRLGQGGILGLKAAFYKRFKREIIAAEMNMGQEHGKEHLFAHIDALLASEGESESSQGSSDEEERAASTAAPSATTSSGPSSFASRNECSAGGKDKEDREEDEDEGHGDDEEREEDEQPPPPPENTRKKDSRKKSKRGRKSR
ncbi:unnamed protein product [Sphagnum troendelagicum]|uniref:Pinin/SDK/MemA protein domain-containing protein n=1 Tax=Sphagnum troendelagicum TaxID=128251 RepID=A0ABP0U2A0_9BRYO